MPWTFFAFAAFFDHKRMWLCSPRISWHPQHRLCACMCSTPKTHIMVYANNVPTCDNMSNHKYCVGALNIDIQFQTHVVRGMPNGVAHMIRCS
jgi:hypothetical protein